MNSKQRLLITSTLILAATLAASIVTVPVLADNAHFIGTPTIIKNPDGSLSATFKAAGLGSTPINIFLSSSGGSADLQCVNPGGNNPPPKHVNFGPLQGEVVTVQPRNGQVTATTGPLGPPPLPTASQICPNSHWSITIVTLTYTNVVLHVGTLAFSFGTVDP